MCIRDSINAEYGGDHCRMGNQPGSNNGAPDDQFSEQGYEDFLRRTGAAPAVSESPKSIGKNPIAADEEPADDDLDLFAPSSPKNRSRERSDSTRSQSDTNPFSRPPASALVPITKPSGHKRADSSSNPFSKPVGGAAAEADSSDEEAPDVLSPEVVQRADRTEEKKANDVQVHEVIERAVEALGGESLWVCVSKRGVAYRFSTESSDKDSDHDGLEFGDLCACAATVEAEDGTEYLKIAMGKEGTTYFVPTTLNNRPLLLRLTSEDAIHGETTSIFRVDKDDGAKYCNTPVYDSVHLTEGLDDNHILTSRIVMVGELGHRFALDPWKNRWVPEKTPRGRTQLYPLNLMKENVRHVYRVVSEQGIAFRASPRFHEKLPGDDGVDRGDVLAVHALMKSMTRPHEIWFALVANSVRWLPLTSSDGDDLLQKVETTRSVYTFQVLDRDVNVYKSPDFSDPADASLNEPAHKIITCCAKVAGPAGGGVEFFLLTDGKHWVSNEDEMGEEQLRRVKMMAHPFLYKCVKPVEDNRIFMLPAIDAFKKNADVVTRFKESELIAARLRVEANGVLFILCAKTLTWYPTVECSHRDDSLRDPLFEFSGSRGTLVHLKMDKLGIKDATKACYTNPYIKVSVVNVNGQFLEDHDTPYATQVKDRHLVFGHSVTLDQPLEILQQNPDCALFLEFKHYKKDKHIVSTKCYSLVTQADLERHYQDYKRADDNPQALQLEIYRCEKPTDFSRQNKPSRLSVKELYQHVTLSFTKYQKARKKK
eukprot:TRINITY_DN10590_c0_g2_i5.p1 TRINITY_DN10590_c0_g2~~TRINITY_DN10590_c0_g2_i5.p1  ORF type:complete len:767 (+),score=183.24 TRINITY_DN10590_c0_g2_i5:65-2365(+)